MRRISQILPFRFLSAALCTVFVSTELGAQTGAFLLKPQLHYVYSYRKYYRTNDISYPSTSVRFGLPTRSHVTRMVYNTLGQQIAKLVQEEQTAGYHEVKFDASALSSGIDFYRLPGGTYVETRTLVFLR